MMYGRPGQTLFLVSDGATLAPALDAAARACVNHSRGVRLDGAALIVSSIYKWYADDLGGSYAPLRARQQAANLIDRDVYDWSLNAVPAR